jgi:dTDP-4-dehydrorhamnose 3,5-epimerase
MKFIPTKLPGLMIIESNVFEDERGFFIRRYNEKEFQTAGISHQFVEDNHSLSKKGVLRGLHFQKKPFPLAKLVLVSSGAVLDVVVDLRKNSPTYKQWFSLELTAENKKMLFVPEGFAHGFLSLADNTLMQYKYSNHYHPALEQGLLWNDPEIKIDWQLKRYEIEFGIKELIISKKDQNNFLLKELENELE